MTEAQELIYKPVPPVPYGEISHSVHLRFAFVNRNKNLLSEIFTPVACRDFLSDVLHAEYFKIDSTSIYGFKYKSSKQKIDRDRLRMGLYSHSESTCANVLTQALSILNPIEEQNKFKLSTITKLSNNSMFIEGDVKWQHNSFLLGIYTLLLRLSGNPFKNASSWLQETKKQKVATSDFYFLSCKNFETYLSKLCKFNEELDQQKASPTGWKLDTPIGIVHNRSGVYSTLSKPPVNPVLSGIAQKILSDLK